MSDPKTNESDPSEAGPIITSETPTDPETRAIPLWVILFGLAPAVWLMACGLFIGLFIGPINIHPESPGFPHWTIDLPLGGMVVIAIAWAFVVLRKVEMHWLLRIPAIIVVAVIAHFVNFTLAMAGCGVVGDLGSLVD